VHEYYHCSSTSLWAKSHHYDLKGSQFTIS
jgi:hypothetical protein